MPGVFHELLVFLIRSMPGCAQALLALATPPDWNNDWLNRPLGELTVVDSNLSVDAGRELRADLTLVEDPRPPARHSTSNRSTPSLRGLVFEIQLDAPKQSKERAWLAYCAEFWLRERVEPVLLIVTDDDAVVRRASRSLNPVGPALGLRPWVLHCRSIVSIFIDESSRPTAALDAKVLRKDPSIRGLFLLAVAYSLRCHPEAASQFRPFLRDVLDSVDASTAVRYTDAVSQLSPNASQLVESIMRPYKEEPYEFKSKYFRPAYLKGIAEGKAEGEAEGRAEGKAEGRAEGKAEGEARGRAEGILVGQRQALKRVLVCRNELTADAERQIDAAEAPQLEQWLDQVALGTTPSELRERR